MDTLSRDLVFAVRMLRRNPAFTVIAIITIALGIGASTAIFSVVNAVLLRPLPYDDADRLVLLWGDLRNRGVSDFPTAPADFHDLREQATTFEALAGVFTNRPTISGDGGEPEQIRSGNVTPNFFATLGARVVRGRDFTDADGTPPAPPPNQQASGQRAASAPQGQRGQPPAGQRSAQVIQQPQVPPPPIMVILSHDFWMRRYGGDPLAVGRSIRLGNGSGQIIGVLEPGFELLFPPNTNVERRPDIWTAMRVNYEAGSRINVFLRVVGKLKPGVTIQQAQAQVEAITADLRERFPIKQTAGLFQRLEPIHKDLVADVRTAILALMGAVTFVLLIACANVANLLLVRTSARERELAVRAALGGGKWRLVRQLLAESLILAGTGAVLGVLLAQFGVRLLLVLRPENLPRIESISVNPAVLGFTALAALLSAVLFGLMPAVRASRPNVADVLRESSRTPGLRAGRVLRNGVVIAEVALSFVLLVGSGLMLRSFIALQRTWPGFNPENVLTFAMNFPARPRFDGRAFVQQVREELQAIQGVTAVTAASQLPLDGGSGLLRWGTEAALSDPNAFQQATSFTVLPGFFETLGTAVLDGRGFTEADNNPDERIVVIDRTLAARAFPNQSAVGKRILARTGPEDPEWYDIVGVVEHQRHTTLAEEGRESIYFTFAHLGNINRWAVRTTGDPARVATAIRAAIARIDPLATISEMQPMRNFVERSMAGTRFAFILIGIFAGTAAVLAAVGLYGVLSTVVRQRTAEIGVRVAFGAPRNSIFNLVVGQGLRLSAAGIVLGLLAALPLTQLMTSMLVGVRPTDVATFATMSILFLAVAALACWLPARRAAGLDPISALREE
jgi:putative ABC transport system permease protein